MSALLLVIVAVLVAFVFGWIRGFLSGVRHVQPWIPEPEAEFIDAQRKHAEWQ